jgi:hypothetical protein
MQGTYHLVHMTHHEVKVIAAATGVLAQVALGVCFVNGAHDGPALVDKLTPVTAAAAAAAATEQQTKV